MIKNNKYSIATDKPPTKFIVYKVTNLVNGKIYVGQTTRSMRIRISSHVYSVKKGESYPFISALRKYGLESFRWEVIDFADSAESLNKQEEYYIRSLGSLAISGKGYNIRPGGNQSSGYKKTVNNRIVKTSNLFYVFNKNKEMIMESKNQRNCAENLKVFHTLISACLSGKRLSTGGYYFIYADKNIELELSKLMKTKVSLNKKSVDVYSKDGVFIKTSKSMTECAKELGITMSGISMCARGERKTHMGYVFKYSD